jgi:hypothetical protein
MSAADALRRIATSVQAWFADSGTRCVRSSRSRWIQVGLTVTLLAAGVVAWAVALVQPWKAKAADPGMVAVPGQPQAHRVREAAEEGETLFEQAPPPALPALSRNPFETPAWAVLPDGATGPSATASARSAAVSCDGDEDLTAKAVAETVRGLQLKATVRSTRGERWVVINEKVYREGDEVAGLALVEIGDAHATLRGGGVTCVIRMD